MKKIGVGLVGASPLNPGWAVTAHVPAVLALPQYELRAVSTSRRESADAAREAFGVPAACDNHHDFIYDAAVDLVGVTVKVMKHYEIVSAALDAGKVVFSECRSASTRGSTVPLISLPGFIHASCFSRISDLGAMLIRSL